MQPTASPTQTSTAGSPLRLAQLGAAGIVAFVPAIIALHVLAPELDPRTHFMSEYGLTRYGWLLTTGLVALGAGSLALAGALRGYATTIAQKVGNGLLAIWGVGVAIAGVVPLDAGLLEPVGAGGYVHLISSMIAFLSLVAAVLVLTFRGPGALQRPPVRGALRILAGVLVLAFLADFAPPEAVRGLTQRVFVLTCVAWLLALARGLGTADGVASRP